jgi:hypothetical protein
MTVTTTTPSRAAKAAGIIYRRRRTVQLSSQRELVLEAIQNSKSAVERAVTLKDSANDPQVRELATAVHFLGYALQQVGLALTDEGRQKNLNV